MIEHPRPFRLRRAGELGTLWVMAAALAGCGSDVGVAKTYTIGGTASGLTGTAVLQVNGGDSLSVSSGRFKFPTAVANGASYNVTLLTQPTNEACTVSSGAGTVNDADVTTVGVACVGQPDTLVWDSPTPTWDSGTWK